MNLKIASVCLFCLWCGFAEANYAYRHDVQAFIAEMDQQYGLDKKELKALFEQAEFKSSAFNLINPKPRKNKPAYVPWHRYKKNFINQTRIKQGVNFWSEHEKTLQRAEKIFAVPAEIIVAIIGVETSYGRIMGSFRVFDVLTTLGFDSLRRQTFFRKELQDYLLLTSEQGINPLSIKGSYAGAMGYGQFMPSSYRRFAVDFDGDKHIDIWNNPVDAIGSVANYFKQHGWVYQDDVVVRAFASDNADASGANQTRKPDMSIGALKRAGFFPYQSSLSDQRLASLVELQGDFAKEYWLGLQNFYVITEYNHSRRYALAVYQLAQEIKARHNKHTLAENG